MINGAYLHLLTNHIPVIGIPICFALLAASQVRKSRDLLQAALIGFVLMGLAALVVDQSGDRAAKIVKDLPGIVRTQIHDHAAAADGGLNGSVAIGGLSLMGLWFLRRPAGLPKALTALLLIASLGVSIWLGHVAHLGGLIRHPEIEIHEEKMP